MAPQAFEAGGSAMSPEAREASDVDCVAEAWAETLMSLNPVIGTRVGRAGVGFADYSPEGAARLAGEARAALSAIRGLLPSDGTDLVTARELERELNQLLDEHEAGLRVGELNVIVSPLQEIRDSFDLMPRESEEDRSRVSERLAEVPAALTGYREALGERSRSGPALARRQILAVAAQAERVAEGHFTRQFGTNDPSSALGAELTRRTALAEAAFGSFAEFLRHELAPYAGEVDSVGADLYAIMSRRFLGTEIDAGEWYERGFELLAELSARQLDIAREISGSASVQAAIAVLDEDPSRSVHGVDALRRWLQETSEAAVTALSGVHFDIPPELRRLECRIAPSQDGGIYYTEPDESGRRPGRMWWSVPPGVSDFRVWREKTTVYHEGVPGHHLQMGGAALAGASLNLWRRGIAGTSGSREGWALYAEQLMQQLGFLEDPGELLGMIDAQRMRAARVVLDIGLHTGRKRHDGGSWTAESAFEFMRANTVMAEPSLRYEVLRYLGWPGQGSSYSIGQSIWEDLRADSERRAMREGKPHDLRDFHTRALALGGLGLDTLRWAMSAEGPAQKPGVRR